MSNWGWVIGILVVLGIIAYANPDLFDKVRLEMPKIVDRTKLGKSELESVCLSKINENLDILKKQTPSDTKINLVDYKTFNNKKDAIEYAKLWERSSLFLEKSLEDINNLEENSTMFLGVTKVEAYNVLIQSRVAITAVIVCSNNTILQGSKKQLT